MLDFGNEWTTSFDTFHDDWDLYGEDKVVFWGEKFGKEEENVSERIVKYSAPPRMRVNWSQDMVVIIDRCLQHDPTNTRHDVWLNPKDASGISGRKIAISIMEHDQVPWKAN